MSTTVDAGRRLPPWPDDASGTGRPAAADGDRTDDPVALLQAYQATRISPPMIEDAERRLHRALAAAQEGVPVDPSLLLRQLATDLGITLSLA